MSADVEAFAWLCVGLLFGLAAGFYVGFLRGLRWCCAELSGGRFDT